MENCETCGNLIEGGTPFSRYCDMCLHTCRICEIVFESAEYRHECDSCTKKVEEAAALILDRLEWTNAHTIAALLNWETFGKVPYGATDYKMLKGYKAAQLEIFGTK